MIALWFFGRYGSYCIVFTFSVNSQNYHFQQRIHLLDDIIYTGSHPATVHSHVYVILNILDVNLKHIHEFHGNRKSYLKQNTANSY